MGTKRKVRSMDMTGKAASLALMGLSSLVATKLATIGWKKITGDAPPTQEEGAKLGQIIVFAAVSAALVAALQFAARRNANRFLPASIVEAMDQSDHKKGPKHDHAEA